MKLLALAAISFYQRYLSPYKGFVCAFRRHTGRDSCSAHGKRVIARYGLWQGLTLLRRRLDACGEVHRHHQAPQRTSMRHRAQAGHCDASCDLPHLHCGADEACQALDCVSSGCDVSSCRDWGRRRRRDDEMYVRMPPPPGL
ncbi:putative component of membrane protein insertase Oxa1/YidC/SpoIIIJ protein YidD [Duganella sp. 1224]|uniref:membrane protein insertion efficiency factor YidD n=1 Tax=Duganella sp. 1224 TaxID=2587052 RepID=UPI0015CA035C|nr:membrane protein insertion efficiency factor YidD [Duganella sp. 1224]NYE60365.1 putative component of membrane protein insertase Oxa1/YidC/SpoIIIJ protein YidD [Duganella sp. 1224]